jgi:hypothetical protein
VKKYRNFIFLAKRHFYKKIAKIAENSGHSILETSTYDDPKSSVTAFFNTEGFATNVKLLFFKLPC